MILKIWRYIRYTDELLRRTRYGSKNFIRNVMESSNGEKRLKVKKMIGILLCVCMLFATGCNTGMEDFGEPVEGTEKKLKIVTTAFPPYDFARQLAGEQAEIWMLLKPGSEAHNYEPTPQDIIAIQECDVFLYIGGEAEDWVEQVLDSTNNPKMKVLALMDCVEGMEHVHDESCETKEGVLSHGEDKGEHSHSGMDEHIWTSPVNVMEISRQITACLIEAKPDKASYFEERLQKYMEQLEQLDHSFREIVRNSNGDTLFFGDRFPFLYFTEEYDLSYFAAFPGCSSESEPSAATMIDLVDKIREEKVSVVFTLALSSDKIADVLCEETGAKKLVLQDCHSISREDFENGETYISLMTKNAEQIKIALE